MLNGRKIFIVSFDCYNGGTVVLSELCRQLRKLGTDAIIIRELSRATSPKITVRTKYLFRNIVYNILIKTNRTKLLNYKLPRHFADTKIALSKCCIRNNDIVIYPEIICGNPLKATNVIRWLLFHYKYNGNPHAYSPKDLFICYRNIFNDLSLNPNSLIVHIAYFDANLYRQYNYSTRMGNCYIIRKGHQREDLPEQFDGPIIDNMTELDKVETFNKCKRCYCYDTQTFYSSIAAICGCTSIVILEPGKKRGDYFSSDDRPKYGVAYGNTEEEIKWAESTRNLLIDSLDFSEHNKKNAQNLIGIMTSYFE